MVFRRASTCSGLDQRNCSASPQGGAERSQGRGGGGAMKDRLRKWCLGFALIASCLVLQNAIHCNAFGDYYGVPTHSSFGRKNAPAHCAARSPGAALYIGSHSASNCSLARPPESHPFSFLGDEGFRPPCPPTTYPGCTN